jgi:hypothetical protein
VAFRQQSGSISALCPESFKWPPTCTAPLLAGPPVILCSDQLANPPASVPVANPTAGGQYPRGYHHAWRHHSAAVVSVAAAAAIGAAVTNRSKTNWLFRTGGSTFSDGERGADGLCRDRTEPAGARSQRARPLSDGARVAPRSMRMQQALAFPKSRFRRGRTLSDCDGRSALTGSCAEPRCVFHQRGAAHTY